MKKSVEILNSHIENMEKILIAFTTDEKSALSMMEDLKKALSKKHDLPENEREMYEPSVYNALATINSAPNQKKANSQLLEAITDAKEELRVISEIL